MIIRVGTLCLWLSTLFFITGCFTTRHNYSSSHGFTFKWGETMLVGVHDNTIINKRDTQILIKSLEKCGIRVIDLSKIDAKEYRSFFDLDAPDSVKIETVAQNTRADYMLLGSYLSIHDPGGPLGLSNPNQYDQDFQRQQFEPKSEFEFVLYDLNKDRELLRTITRTEPITFFFNGRNDQEYWAHPTNPFLLIKNQRKARKKLKKLCRC